MNPSCSDVFEGSGWGAISPINDRYIINGLPSIGEFVEKNYVLISYLKLEGSIMYPSFLLSVSENLSTFLLRNF
jgi:hypothetical protein